MLTLISRRSLRAAENATAISAAAPTRANDDEPDESRAHSQCFSCFLHRAYKYLAHQRHQYRDNEKRSDCQSERPGRLVLVAVIRARKQFLVRLEREQQRQPVCDYEQHGETGAELLRHYLSLCQIEVGDR
jgi:hypothetical protein